MSTNLPGELCGVVEQFAVLRKRPLRECQLELTRLQYTTPNHMFPPDDERPTECSDNFSEIVYYGDTEVFGFDYNHYWRCGHFQMFREPEYCACSRMYRVRATLLSDLPFTDQPLFWFALFEDVSSYKSVCEKWQLNRCFLLGSPERGPIQPWFRGGLRFRKPTIDESGLTMQCYQDAIGFATEKSTERFLYWLVLVALCHHTPGEDHCVPSGHDNCERVQSVQSACWLDSFLPELVDLREASEPPDVRFTWIELDGPLSDLDPALEK
jgi:hypothetical protein